MKDMQGAGGCRTRRCRLGWGSGRCFPSSQALLLHAQCRESPLPAGTFLTVDPQGAPEHVGLGVQSLRVCQSQASPVGNPTTRDQDPASRRWDQGSLEGPGLWRFLHLGIDDLWLQFWILNISSLKLCFVSEIWWDDADCRETWGLSF